MVTKGDGIAWRSTRSTASFRASFSSAIIAAVIMHHPMGYAFFSMWRLTALCGEVLSASAKPIMGLKALTILWQLAPSLHLCKNYKYIPKRRFILFRYVEAVSTLSEMFLICFLRQQRLVHDTLVPCHQMFLQYLLEHAAVSYIE
jgi:hypothetical protein